MRLYAYINLDLWGLGIGYGYGSVWLQIGPAVVGAEW